MLDFLKILDDNAATSCFAECHTGELTAIKEKMMRVVRDGDKLYVVQTPDNYIQIEFPHSTEKEQILTLAAQPRMAVFATKPKNFKAKKPLWQFICTSLKELDIKTITITEDFSQKSRRNQQDTLLDDFIIPTTDKLFMVFADRGVSPESSKETSIAFVGIEPSGRLVELTCNIKRDENDNPYIEASQRNVLQNKEKYSFSLLEVTHPVFTRQRDNIREKTVALISGRESAFLSVWREYCYSQYKRIVKSCIEGGLCEIHSFDAEGFFVAQDNGIYTFSRFISALKKSGIQDCYALSVDENSASQLKKFIEETGELSEESVLLFRELIGGMDKKSVGLISIDVGESLNKGVIVLDQRTKDAARDLHSSKYLLISGRSTIASLEKQELAFETIMNAKSPMPQLAEILLGIDSDNEIAYKGERRKKTHLEDVVEYFPFKPTLNQISALKIALETPDFAIILGPPGTGKSALIKALIRGIEKYEKPNNGTLMTTYQQDALDNLMSNTSVNGLPCIRYGGKNSDNARILSVDLINQIQEKAKSLETKYPQYKTAGILYHFRESIAALDYMQLSYGSVSAFLEDILEYACDVLPRSARREIEKLKNHYSARADKQGLDAVAADIAKLRDTKCAYDDDGELILNSIVAIHLLFATQSIKTLFDEYKASARNNDFDRTKELRNRIIAEFTAQKKPYLSASEKANVKSLLEQTVVDVEARLKERGDFEAEIISDYINSYTNNYGETLYAIKKYNKYVGVSHYQLDNKRIGKYLDAEEFENVIIDEAARSSPMDLMVVMSRASKRIILVGDHNQLPQFQEPDVYLEAVEQLRKKRAEGLGVSAENEEDNADCSLFEKLIEIATKMRKSDGIVRYAMLKEQYRSPSLLGSFVSNQFYNNQLENGAVNLSGHEHNIVGYDGKCAVFKEIPLSNGLEQKKNGKSRYRVCEANWIAGDIQRILSSEISGLSIGVMSFYAAQCEEVYHELSRAGVMAKSEDEVYQITQQYAKNDCSVYVGTVDSYQGKEFDVVYLSITVANDKGEIGFLKSPNRRCVAFSREKKLLIVVGAPEMAARIDDIREYRALCENEAEGLVLQ